MFLRVLLAACLFTALGSSVHAQLKFDNAVVALIDDVSVPALDSAQVTEVLVKPGQKVAKGEVIARLDIRQLETQRAVIEAELKIAQQAAESEVNIRYARKSTDVAQRVLQRSREANTLVSRSVTATEIDRLRLEAERSELSIEQAEVEMESLRMQIELQQKRLAVVEQQIQDRTVTSPINGMIIDISVSYGEWAQVGQTVARVVELNKVKVQALAAGDAIDSSYTGKKVVVTAVLPISKEKVEFEGVLTFVNPEITPATGLLQLTAEIENAESKLRPGQKVSMLID